METFVARQPIFDRQRHVFAYELFFRSSLDNVFSAADPNAATLKVIVDSFLLLGIASVTGGKKAFINITRDVLLMEYMTLLPQGLLAVELLETVEPDPEVIAACTSLKKAGYLLALDDFVYDERYMPLVQLADIIKVDFLATDEQQRRAMVRRFAPYGIRCLAEKVETHEAFQEALDLGYTYFQGYFFSRPKILSGKDLPAFKLHLLQLLQEINRPELDFALLEDIIKREMSLSYKLLRYINSAFFQRRQQINSIKQALVLLGEREIKHLISLITVAMMGQDKPMELVVLAVIRAKFCESVASSVGLAHRAQDLFLLGMFSAIDAILDQPLADILDTMPLAADVKAALLGEDSPLRPVKEYILAYERGAWDQVSERAAQLGLSEAGIPTLYRQAVAWCQESFHGSYLTA